ncbi:hypothetical protein L3X38_027714 [Prunus dulcis]|uniref:RNase H type-1 domain-containing protein n=1 Tax=Prunus dulcis TaxID=3755 RepID=A0AAD4VQC4_PRUDU|nr:hypothetical protein L3X38_027714 [Prunus dulcis]
MTAYLQHTRHLLVTFDAHLITQVPRSENNYADALARLASALEQGISRNIHIEFLDQPSICGNHSAIRQGYFCPSLHNDAQAFTQKCDKGQRFANIPQLPPEPLTATATCRSCRDPTPIIATIQALTKFWLGRLQGLPKPTCSSLLPNGKTSGTSHSDSSQTLQSLDKSPRPGAISPSYRSHKGVLRNYLPHQGLALILSPKFTLASSLGLRAHRIPLAEGKLQEGP